MSSTLDLVDTLRAAEQDFEWYPTTRRMVDAVLKSMGSHDVDSILDIGAGDGRVLAMLAEKHDGAKLFAIEKSSILQQQQPDRIIPVGTEFAEQDLMSLPVDVAFCNPPYSQYEAWAHRIIGTVYTDSLFLVLPQRWEDSALIRHALRARSATARIIHRDDFHDAERRARAIVHVIRITFPNREYRHRQDPFDLWFDQNIDTFEREDPIPEHEQEKRDLARLRDLDSIGDLVAAFDEDYRRMQEHYKAIFLLDAALLKELGVNKESVREGLKKRMQGLKHTYWQALFDHLDVITARLTTKTKKGFLERLTGQTAIAFTVSNAYAVVLWAIKAANQYFDAQVVDVFRQLSTHDGVSNYVSNQRTWQKDGWRYRAADHSHYALDYRVVLEQFRAIHDGSFDSYDYPGKLHTSGHEVIDDLIAVFGNLGFPLRPLVSRRVEEDGAHHGESRMTSRVRLWTANVWQDFLSPDGTVLFQVKAFQNGNLHFRFLPDAIKALNIEAGRLLGWLRGPADVVQELGYTTSDAERFFGSNQRLGASTVKLLGARS
jgi:hypothetical protein